MCLGVPGKVIETYADRDVLMARVDFGGVAKAICVEYTPDVSPGEYVIVHVGFSLQVIDEAEAKQVFAFLEQMEELETGS